MLVLKYNDCEYLGFEDGRHKVLNKKTGGIELVKQFKLVLAPDVVEIYLPTGKHAYTHNTMRRLQS